MNYLGLKRGEQIPCPVELGMIETKKFVQLWIDKEPSVLCLPCHCWRLEVGVEVDIVALLCMSTCVFIPSMLAASRLSPYSNESWMRSSMMTAPSIPHYSLVATPPSLLAWWAYSLRAPVYNFCFLHTFMLRSHMSMDINWQPFQYLLCCRNVWPLPWSPCYILALTMPLSACDLTSYCPNQKCLLHLLLSTEWPSEEQ